MFARQMIISGILFFSYSCYAQEKVDELVGYYMSADNNIILRFYRSDTKYYGKIVWIKRASRVDSLNPDKTKRDQRLLGSHAGWDFVYMGNDTWNRGRIYDANSGKVYKATITRDKNGNMAIRGYIGLKILGKTEYFTKVTFKE